MKIGVTSKNKLKIKQTLKKIGIGTMLVGLAYGSLYGASAIAYESSPKIQSQTRLENLIEEEKKKLKCNKDIKAELFGSLTPYSAKKGNGAYEIKLNGKLATESILKHELYHICDGHVDSGYSRLKFYFWHEPQAILYETMGLEF